MSFVNSIFLFGAAAMAVPLMLHFVRQMKAKQIPFGSLMFLTATAEQVIKKRKLRDILLMLTRAAFVGLLAFVFARPFLESTEISFLAGDESSSTVILLDHSYSMAAGDAFENAKSTVLEKINAASGDDEIAVILFSDHMRQLTGFDTEPSIQASIISGISQSSFRATEFYEPLRAAEDILMEARNDDRRVVLVSDFQMNGWSGAFDNWNLPSGIAFETVNVGGSDVSNSYIDDFDISQRRVGSIGQEIALRIDSRVGWSSTATTQVEATLELSGQTISTQTVPAVDQSRVTFQHSLESSGVYQGSIRLPDDGLEIDNNYYFTTAVTAKPSVFAVDSRGRTQYSDAFFLRTAFDLGIDGPYNFDSGSRSALTNALSPDNKVLFLANQSQLTANEKSRILRWVEAGGHLVFSQGAAVAPGSISSTLHDFGIGTSDAIVNSASEFGERSIIGDIESRHPVFRELAKETGGVILRPQFRRYLRVTPDSSAAVLASFDNGDPFLIERKHGRGSIIVHTSTINNAWTDFPVDELYVPFLYQLVGYAIDAASPRVVFQVGDVVSLPGGLGSTWEVQTPGDDIFQVETDGIDENGVFSPGLYRQTELPGHYLAINGSERFHFSVNVDPSESILRARDEAEAYAAVASPFVEQDSQIAGLTTSGDERQSLWQYILAIVLIVLMIETVVANRRVKKDSI